MKWVCFSLCIGKLIRRFDFLAQKNKETTKKNTYKSYISDNESNFFT